jgi:hypothetical protein
MIVGPHGQEDGLEYEAAPPVPTVWVTETREPDGDVRIRGGGTVRWTPPSHGWAVERSDGLLATWPCDCPPCRALAAPATGDE